MAGNQQNIYPPLDDQPHIQLSEEGISTNIQPQMNAAMSVAEHILQTPASVRKVSMKPGEVTKSGMFKKKKSSEPSLVFTVSGNETADFNQDDWEQTTSFHVPDGNQVSLYPANTQNTLSVQQNLSAESVASFRSVDMVSTVSQGGVEKKHEKNQRFYDFFTMVISICYGIFVLILSITLYSTDLFLPNSSKYNNTEHWNLFLSSVGILLLLYLIYDIQIFIWKINKKKGEYSLNKIKFVTGPDGELNIEIPMKGKRGKKKKFYEYYGFATGRHAGSFFLKIGAAFFCFGHLIHVGLNIVKHLYVLNAENVCAEPEIVAYDVIYMLYSLVQMYFVYKFGNVIVNRNKWLARFTFIHCLSSSLSFWINTLIEETLDALVKKYFVNKDPECDHTDSDHTDHAIPMDNTSLSYTTQPVSPFGHYTLADCVEGVGSITNNIICVIWARKDCNTGGKADDIFGVAPWFYPFSIEFSILIVAIWYILWSSIGNIEEHKDSIEFLPSVSQQGSMENINRTAGHKQNMIIYADCTNSNMGIGLGAVLIVFVIVVSLIVIVNEGKCDPEFGLQVGNIMKITVLTILIITTIVAYYIISQFDVNPQPISFLDDMLLFMCLPFFFAYFLIHLISCVVGTFDTDTLAVNILTLIQVLIQTPMIVDGLRRCSYAVEDQNRMKGREVIAFLIVANLAVYVMETLMIKSYDYQTNELHFYGPNAWTILSHATLPICIFYRFHSAVALVDIWKCAYKEPEEHH